MEPEQTKVWSRAEVREHLGAILVESLGVEAAAVSDGASLVQELGAESIDFLDISFKAQQVFGVDLPTRLIQDQILEWRSLRVFASVLAEQYRVSVPAEELCSVTPSTVSAVFKYLREKHGLATDEEAERPFAEALAARLVSQMGRLGLDASGVETGEIASLLLDNVHSPQVMEEFLRRFTVGALANYIADRLAAESRLVALGPPHPLSPSSMPLTSSPLPRGERQGEGGEGEGA